MKRVFISYRRHDSKYQARMIHAAFALCVTRDNVFMDVDSIPPGANFRKILKGWVDACDVLLALVGPGWLDVTDPATGLRRLDSASDFVRIEIGEALARDIPVVPVLLDGAALPHPDQLPSDLKELCDRQAEFVEYRTFDADVARLIKKLGLGEGGAVTIAQPPPKPSTPAPIAAPNAASAVDRYRAESRIRIDAKIFHGESEAAQAGWLKPGAGKVEWFKDLDIGPEMVVVPGDPALAIGRFAVTFAEWDAAQAHPEWERYAKIEPRKANDNGWGRGKQPVIDVSWNDAKAYCAWASAVTGKTYRLPSDAEWELACRAGTKTEFWWGDKITPDQANFGHNKKRTVPVDSFDANPWGLHQVHGNVWEWCEDAYGSSSRVVRGGSWDLPVILHSSLFFWCKPDYRNVILGFRVARVLSPARTL